MLQRLLEVSGRSGGRPRVFCNSVYAALSGLIQELLIVGNPAVDLLSTDSASQNQTPVFDRVRNILIQSHLVDAAIPISETKSGVRRLRVANPYYIGLHIPPRIRLDAPLEPVAAILQAFLVLRVRYQIVASDRPLVRLEALVGDDPAIDTLYLVGDAFTERYLVHAELQASAAKIILTLTGEPPAVTGGLTWARGDYIRSRDASLLLHPLKEALELPTRPLAIPRETPGILEAVRARLPGSAQSRIAEIHWVTSLHALADGLPSEPLMSPDVFGAHMTAEPTRGGYIIATSATGTESILPVRALERPSTQRPIPPERSDGRIAITFEALGGAREIAANSYYYGFGHRGLLVDVGYDATRDGWLGTPVLERIQRLDAIILTHAHLDHVGALPLVLGAFPRVPVYCTMPTFAVLGPTLRDSARVAGFRLAETGEAPAISSGLANLATPDRFRILPYDVATPIKEIPGLTITFRDAGHVIGSAAAYLQFSGVDIIHTGDISVEDQHLLRGLRINELSAAHVVMEGTYSGEPEFTRAHRRAAVDEFFDALRDRLADGGSVLIPAFSLGRAQELVAMIADWSERQGILVPIRTVGLVNVLNDISAAHLEFLPGASGNPFQRCRSLDVRPVRGETDKERAARYAGAFLSAAAEAPCVIVASHGMMVENTGSYLIGRAILEGNDPRHAVFLCGYMDPRTPGFRLRNQKHRDVIDYGAGDPVRRSLPSERIHFYRLTAHASYEELVEAALSLPSKSLTLIHGESASLTSLKADVDARLASAKRQIEVRVPAIGERLLIDHAPAPIDWDFDPLEDGTTDVLISDRRFLGRGYSVRGQYVDVPGWILIPVGRPSMTLILEHDRLGPDRIINVTIVGRHNPRTVVYDRAAGYGSLTKIDAGQPDDSVWHIEATEPDGHPVRARPSIRCGAELRPTRSAINANAPVVELEVGGSQRPKVVEVRSGLKGQPLPIAATEWLSDSRLLRITLQNRQELDTIPDLHVVLRWPNGFVQEGPSLGTFTLEPDIQLEAAVAVVGRPVRIEVSSTPQPSAARFDGVAIELEPNSLTLIPRRPGVSLVELGYRTRVGDIDWHEAGTVNVAPAARLEIVGKLVVDEDIHIRIADISPHFFGKEVALRLGDQILARWTAGDTAHDCQATVRESGIVDVSVIALADELVLCTRAVDVHSGLALDPADTFPIATADGVLHAELTWIGPKGYDRGAVERAITDGGFAVVNWAGDTVYVRGSSDTLGWKEIHVADGERIVDVRLLTIRSLELSLTPSGLLELGQAVSLQVGGGEVSDGLNSLDGGPLNICADRVEPFFDDLSLRIEGHRIHFINPGTYSIALAAYGRRLAQVQTTVRRPEVRLQPASRHVRVTEASMYGAATRLCELAPSSGATVFAKPDGSFEMVVDERESLLQIIGRFLEDRFAERAKVVVAWPGVALPRLGGDVLRELRLRSPEVAVAHLSYPAPRGEIVSDAEHARRLREYGVLCSAQARATIERWDAYSCPRCRGRLFLQTNDHIIWLACSTCHYDDRHIVLTLARLRSSDIEVLFTDFRMARYLRQGTGIRYGGSFSRSVRCTRCHAIQPAYSRPVPWDKTELHRLITATLTAWNASTELEVARRAARVVARATGSTPADTRRFEELIHRLIAAGVFNEGRVAVPLERLENGLSLCCGARLMWSREAVAHVFVGLEELTADSPARHPALAPGELGFRQLFSLAVNSY